MVKAFFGFHHYLIAFPSLSDHSSDEEPDIYAPILSNINSLVSNAAAKNKERVIQAKKRTIERLDLVTNDNYQKEIARYWKKNNMKRVRYTKNDMDLSKKRFYQTIYSEEIDKFDLEWLNRQSNNPSI